MQDMLQRALGMPQTTPGVAPVQPEVMGPMVDQVDPVAQIQDQLDAVAEEMQQTTDPMMLQSLAGVVRELQIALEQALQAPTHVGLDQTFMPEGY